jgi:hypothetical protein
MPVPSFVMSRTRRTSKLFSASFQNERIQIRSITRASHMWAILKGQPNTTSTSFSRSTSKVFITAHASRDCTNEKQWGRCDSEHGVNRRFLRGPGPLRVLDDQGRGYCHDVFRGQGLSAPQHPLQLRITCQSAHPIRRWLSPAQLPRPRKGNVRKARRRTAYRQNGATSRSGPSCSFSLL